MRLATVVVVTEEAWGQPSGGLARPLSGAGGGLCSRAVRNGHLPPLSLEDDRELDHVTASSAKGYLLVQELGKVGGGGAVPASPLLEEIKEVTQLLHNRRGERGRIKGGPGGRGDTDPRNCLAALPLASQASLCGMAKRPLLLLLALWVLAGELWLSAEARAAPYGVKLCGREFIRAVIFTCGGSRWRRSDILAREAMGEAGEGVCACCGGVGTGRG